MMETTSQLRSDRQARCRNLWCVIGAAMAFTMVSCSDFLEKSIADSTPELLSPGDGAQTNVYALTLMWEPLQYALDYRLQIASPSFDSVAFFHADTTMDKTVFNISLVPGTYQWRVKAQNGSSETAYTTRAFMVHEAALSIQTVLQLAPMDNFLTAEGVVALGWQQLFSANSYRLQVDTNGFSDEKTVLLERVVEGETASVDLTDERRYHWRVRAENDTAQSRWSAVRRIDVDRTPPAVPSPSAPANQAQVNKPVTLRWAGPSDAVSYRLYVYKSDSSLYSNEFPLRVVGTSHVFDAGNRGERILWRVRALDRAGNESAYSAWRSFVVRN